MPSGTPTWVDVALVHTIHSGANPFVVAGITLPLSAQTGQLIAGLEATDTGLGLNHRLSGAGAPQATVDVLARLADLPTTRPPTCRCPRW